MATVQEMMEATADIGTTNEMSVGDTFQGELDGRSDEDWIRIELEAGKTYRIDLTGAAGTDTILTLYDGKGGIINENDDINPAGSPNTPSNLNSRLEFVPEEDGVYYIGARSYTGNPNPDVVTHGTYMLEVMELDFTNIVGSDGPDKLTGTNADDDISGEGGNDVIDGRGGNDEIDGGDDNDLIIGGPGADMITGGDGIDTLSYIGSMEGVAINLRAGTARGGDASGDTLVDTIENAQGSMYDDALSGSRGANRLWGLDGDDTLYGDKGDDTLDGGMGRDDLDGGDGEDTLVGGPGADTLTGGDDDDTASWAGSALGVTVRLHSGQVMGGDAEGDTWGDMVTVEYDNPDTESETRVLEETIPDIIHLIGSGNADILAGDSRDNDIRGGGGDDKLYGGPGGGEDELFGEGGDDMLFGGLHDDMLDGGGGADTLVGGAGDDTYDGGDGDDLIRADDDDTDIDGGDGIDTVSYARVEPNRGVGVTKDLNDFTSVENIIGTAGDDDLTGSDGVDNVVEGGDGADVLRGGTVREGNTDTADTDDDTLSYINSDRRVVVNLTDDDDAVFTDTDTYGIPSGGHAQGDRFFDFESVLGSDFGDDLTGDAADNTLRGRGGDDNLVGGEGADTLEGGAGGDELDGDNGRSDTQMRSPDDVLSYASSDARVVVNLAALTFSGGHAEDDEIAVEVNIDHDGDEMTDADGDGNNNDATDTDRINVSTFEHVIGSAHNDRLTGDHRANTLTGGDGDDTLVGREADDRLNGGAGDDHLRGGIGSDRLNGGPGADTLDGGEMRGERDNMVMVDAATDGRDNDGDGQVDEDGETGMVQATIDWAVYRGAASGVTVDLSTGRGTHGEAEGDRLIDIELVWGSEGDDTFVASADEDIIDIIHGDGGSDTVSYEVSEVGRHR